VATSARRSTTRRVISVSSASSGEVLRRFRSQPGGTTDRRHPPAWVRPPVREGRRQLTSGAWPTGWTARSVSVRHCSSTLVTGKRSAMGDLAASGAASAGGPATDARSATALDPRSDHLSARIFTRVSLPSDGGQRRGRSSWLHVRLQLIIGDCGAHHLWRVGSATGRNAHDGAAGVRKQLEGGSHDVR